MTLSRFRQARLASFFPLLAIGACDDPGHSDDARQKADAPARTESGKKTPAAQPTPPAVPRPPAPAGPRWENVASGEGDALFVADASGKRLLTLFCPADSAALVVNVQAFRPVGSEERMSFGAGGTVIVLVADPNGDARRGGVTGAGPIPAELADIIDGPEGVAVNYGAQNEGPHPPPPAETARGFAEGCRD